MANDIEEFRERLASLGARIDAKVEEFRKQGILHGRAREASAELQIEHARLSQAARDHVTVGGAVADELKIDAEILKHTFDRWIAKIDRESEA
jgi:hypothetical protein